MERLHPVTREQEVPVHIEIAAIVAVNFGSKRVQNLRLVHPFSNPPNLLVAKGSSVATFGTNIVGVLSTSLIWADDCIVTIDGSRNTGPNTFAAITTLDKRQAAWECIVHALAFAFIKNSWPATSTTCHGPIMLILGQAVDEAIPNKDRL